MKKIAVSIASAMVLTSSMGFAEGTVVKLAAILEAGSFFGGLMGGYEHVAVDTRLYNALNNAETLDDTGQNNLFIGLKVGYMFDFNHRIDIAAETTNHSDGLLSIPVSLNYTYVSDKTLENFYPFTDAGFAKKLKEHGIAIQNFHPFAGAGIGLVRWSDTIVCNNASKKLDLDGSMWQVRAGLLYELDQKAEVEVYYRYSRASFDTKHCNENGNNISLDIDNINRNGIFTGINYKF